MATYAIGDVQGCFVALSQLLLTINFDASQDQLWFTGDLVNRGPQSLEVLRFIKNLGEQHITVLGNHDLHLLAVDAKTQKSNRNDTLNDILHAPDKEALLNWLKHRPLMHVDKKWPYVMTHAGIAPMWSIDKAKTLAQEVEAALRGDEAAAFLAQMYGNEPRLWDDRLTGFPRLRCIINYFTRMRLCQRDGSLEFNYKGTLEAKPAALLPWFDVPNRANRESKIIFGHWAALGGKTNVSNIFPLDTGCVWGNCLTALRLDDEKRFAIQC